MYTWDVTVRYSVFDQRSNDWPTYTERVEAPTAADAIVIALARAGSPAASMDRPLIPHGEEGKWSPSNIVFVKPPPDEPFALLECEECDLEFVRSAKAGESKFWRCPRCAERNVRTKSRTHGPERDAP